MEDVVEEAKVGRWGWGWGWGRRSWKRTSKKNKHKREEEKDSVSCADRVLVDLPYESSPSGSDQMPICSTVLFHIMA